MFFEQNFYYFFWPTMSYLVQNLKSSKTAVLAFLNNYIIIIAHGVVADTFSKVFFVISFLTGFEDFTLWAFAAMHIIKIQLYKEKYQISYLCLQKAGNIRVVYIFFH